MNSRNELYDKLLRSSLFGISVVLALLAALPASSASQASSSSSVVRRTRNDSRSASVVIEGAQRSDFEDLDGILLLRARLLGASGRDTSGTLVLDTGSAFLAVDRGVAVALGLADTLALEGSIGLLARPLARLALDSLEFDQVSPVMVMDADVVRRATGRPVLGLIGERLLARYTVWIDFADSTITFVPSRVPAPGEDAEVSSRRALPMLSPAARAIPFCIAGDGKLLVRARVDDGHGSAARGPLTLVLDTGASKTVLFDSALARLIPSSTQWPSLRGISAPTLYGEADARIVRVPALVLDAGDGAVRVRGADAAVMDGDLPHVLGAAVGEPVHGLLGYSFLCRFRVGIDFAHRLMWLDPRPDGGGPRPDEYSSIGIQVEREDKAVRVSAVVVGSPAAVAAIAVGDIVESVDGEDASAQPLMDLVLRLEGPPGSKVEVPIRRGVTRRTLTLVRRRLL
jgi:hypothetical protein